MNSLVEIEEKIEEIFCKKKLTDHIEQYGLIRLTEMAYKLVEDLERQNKSKEVYLCKIIIEFLIGLVRNCCSTNSPKYINQLQSSNDEYLSSLKSTDDKSNAQSASLTTSNNSKKRPPTPPKKPKINRNFHNFQYTATNKDNQELGASNTSLATTISNSSVSNNQNKKKSPAQQSITATRTSSTFASISKNGSKREQDTIHFMDILHQKLNERYTETCLDKDTGHPDDENAYEIKDLGFGSKPKLNSFGVNSKLLNKNLSSNPSHNSCPRQLQQHSSTSKNQQQLRTNSVGNKKMNNFFQLNQQNNNHHVGSLKDSLNYGSTDALCKNSSNAASNSIKNSFFSRKGSLDKHTTSHHAYLPDFGRRHLRLSEDLSSPSNDHQTPQQNEADDELIILQESLDDNNGELNLENYEDTEEELDKNFYKKDAETEDEAIYDTVAPDEVNVGQTNQVISSSINTTNNVNNKINNIKSNRVKNLKNSFENRLLNLSMENLDANNDGGDNRIYSNYVNIDYFLRSKNDSDDCDTQMSQSLSSDHDIDESIAPGISKLNSSSNDILNSSTNNGTPQDDHLNAAYDEVFEYKKEELKNSKSSVLSTQCSMDSADDLDDDIIRTEAELLSMYRSIIQNIIESENVYIDCLDTLIQYKKALKSSTESTQPLLKPEQLECIFYQIPELYKMHTEFIVGVQELSQSSGDNSIIKIRTNTPTLGDLFKNLASQLEVYSKYLRNYSNALDTLRVCCQNNEQFNGIAMSIKLKCQKITTTLQELLHKPVARVQKNALVLHDLLKYTGQHSEEYKSLQTALQMTQCFLNDLNVAATENLFPIQDKAQRRLVKESFIIEFSDGKRKLRHLILFNDILVCAKYKPSSRQKFTFDLKWYASLADITLSTESSDKDKENSGEIMSLRSKVSINRDEIFKVEKSKPNSKLYEKLKKKQADLEGQLVLLLPQLQFSIMHKNSKHYTFYLSSEFERTQWIESIRVLQQSATNHEHLPVNVIELQAWIETCRKSLNPNVGSFLLRSNKDEELLYGDLYLSIIKLSNFKRSGEFFIALETDTYGHFFQKMSTKCVKSNLHNRNAPFRTNTLNSNNSTLSSTNSFNDAASNDDLTSYNDLAVELHFNQEFVIDLDGSQIIRFLLFEEMGNDEKPIFRGKASIEFSRNWLKDKVIAKEISISNSTLSITLKFISSESSTIRFPPGKVYGAFGVPIQIVTKKEKSEVPYLIVGCVREVERRGMKEQGIYRLSGTSNDVQRLKKAFETNPYEAEHLLKEIDINAVASLLKMYLRELPEALFTNALYKKFFEAFGILNNEEKSSKLIELFLQLPLVNQNTINFLMEHLANVSNYENYNKMNLHNLATVFAPNMIYSSNSSNANSGSGGDSFTAGTIDVMNQANIVLFFLNKKASTQWFKQHIDNA